MKYLAILTLIGFAAITSANTAYGLWIPQSPEKLFEQSETVFVGTVTSVHVLEFERSNTYNVEENGVSRIEIKNYTQTLDEYTVDIEEFLKNPQTSNTITMMEATVGGVPGRSVSIGGFELGDRVLFYVPKIDGTNQYSPESFKIPKQCDAKSVLEQSRITLFNDFKIMQNGIEKNDNFTAGVPMKFVYSRDMDSLGGKSMDVVVSIRPYGEKDTVFEKSIHAESKPCTWIASAEWEFTPKEGDYRMYLNIRENGESGGDASYTGFSVISKLSSPSLKQIRNGIPLNEIQCKERLISVQKYDGSPACVKPVTKQHLMDRGWARIVSFDQIQSNHDLIKQNIIRIENGRISLYPENTCALIVVNLLTEQDIQRYKNDKQGLNENNILQITDRDFDEIPIIGELILAVNSLDFPFNEHSSAYMDGLTFVDHEFFLMDKAIQKYGGSQDDYFIKLDEDYKERFSNPKKQGFSNTFEAPLIIYDNKTYSIGGTVFWTSDEHEPMRMTVSPVDEIEKGDKFIVLTDDDMRSVPEIKQAIEGIGMTEESIHGRKGLPEDTQNEYMEWFKEKSQERLNADRFRLIEYDGSLYSVGFAIC